MLTAVRSPSGQRVEASKSLPKSAEYRCPVCVWPVIIKPGRVVVAHFAHQPGGPQCGAEGESIRHMRAKILLAQRFRDLGYDVVLEEQHSGGQRRVDVAVTLQARRGPVRVAVEVQDSAISVDQIQRRNRADKRAGFFATVWVFTTNRLSRARGSLPGAELRLPEEMRYLTNRWRLPIVVLDVERLQLTHVSTAEIVRDGGSYFNVNGEEEWAPDRRLVSTRQITVAAATFELEAVRGRYATERNPDYTARFKAAPVPDRPWRLTATRDGAETVVDLATCPTDDAGRETVQQFVAAGYAVSLDHLPTERRWHRVRRPEPNDPGYRWQPV